MEKSKCNSKICSNNPQEGMSPDMSIITLSGLNRSSENRDWYSGFNNMTQLYTLYKNLNMILASRK